MQDDVSTQIRNKDNLQQTEHEQEQGVELENNADFWRALSLKSSSHKSYSDKNTSDKSAAQTHPVQAWLHLLCSGIRQQLDDIQVLSALVISYVEEDPRESAIVTGLPIAVFPHAAVRVEPLAEIVEQVRQSQTPLVTQLNQQQYAIAMPVLVNKAENDELTAVVALQLSAKAEAQLKPVMRQVQWGIAWLRHYYLSQLFQRYSQNIQQQQSQIHAGYDVLAEILNKQEFDEAAMALVSQLSELFQCDIAVLGQKKSSGMRASYFSNSAQFGKKMNIVRVFEAAMDEAADQLQSIRYSPNQQHSANQQNITKAIVTRAHNELAQTLNNEASYLSVPLFYRHECVAVLSLQRVSGQAFSQQEQQQCESILAFVSPILEQKRLADRNFLHQAKDDLLQQSAKLLGRGYIGRKLFVICCLVLGILMASLSGQYRLAADATVATAMQRAVVAPFDGYLSHAPKRAGDEVQEGEVLVQLDDRELELEKMRWQGQYNQLQRQYQEAIAEHNRARTTIVAAQLEQAQANLQLVLNQIERTRQKSPFTGMIVSGDLSQHLGSAVRKGDVLFEVAPKGQMRLFLYVPENRIADIALEQQGTLYLSALPDQPLAFTINKITPDIISKDKTTQFKVEARLDASNEKLNKLQPGMEGVAKVLVDERKLIDIWTRQLREWLRLQWWKFAG